MSEDPQVVSISSSTPLSPDEIALKSFPAARRGVDGEAVRMFLGKVAAELRAALEREAILRERVAEAERRAEEPVLDEATLTRAIGIETAKILWTAHDAAGNVVAKAEERAAELIAEAGRVLAEQVAACRGRGARDPQPQPSRRPPSTSSRAQAEADSMTDVAHADAVELFDATKEECRRMVAEARGLRNRTLADLVARRRALRVQLEELRTGKDSLLQRRGRRRRVGRRVARAARLCRGRGRVSRPSKLANASRRSWATATSSSSRRSSPQLEVRLEATDSAGTRRPRVASCQASSAKPTARPGPAPRPRPSAAWKLSRIRKGRVRAAAASTSSLPAFAPVAPRRTQLSWPRRACPLRPRPSRPVSSPRSRPRSAKKRGSQGRSPRASGEADQIVEAVADEVGETAETVAVVVAVEVEISEPVRPAPDADAITEPDVESLARRDHLLGSITAKLGRALKRALQDDQNDLLNALRQSSRKPVLDELSPPEVQRERFVTAASDQLAKAYEAGAAFLVTGDAVAGPCVTAPAPSAAVALRSRGLARRRARGRPLRDVAPKDRRVAFRARRKPGGLVGRGRRRVSRMEGDPGRRACR